MPRLLPGDGGDLVAQRFAAAGGHQHQCIATGHHMFNDGLLRAAKVVVAKDFPQDGAAGVRLIFSLPECMPGVVTRLVPRFMAGFKPEFLPSKVVNFVCYHYNSKLSI